MGVDASDVTVVCFDLGGVVVRIARSWDEACVRAGVEVRDPERFHDPGLKQQRRDLSNRYQAGDIDCEAFFEGVADLTDGLYVPEEVRAVHDAWIFEDYPGMGALIDHLNAQPHARTACLSNTNHRHWVEQLLGDAHLEATKRIEHPLASQVLRAVKPDALIYELAEREFAVDPAQIVFFDDLPENVEAARARGWDAVRVDHDVACTSGQIRSELEKRGLA